MPEINEANALALWESGARLSQIDRAVRMAAVAGGVGVGAAADLPISDRDRLLLAALQRIGGENVAVVATCPACATVHEADVALSPLLLAQDIPRATVRIGKRRASIRPPSSRELAAAVAEGDTSGLVSVCCEGAGADADAVTAVEEALEQAFPLLNVIIAMQCDECALSFAQRFDPVPLLWAQVAALAKRAIADVDLLARAYGWSEGEILALSPARRQLYCEVAAR